MPYPSVGNRRSLRVLNTERLVGGHAVPDSRVARVVDMVPGGLAWVAFVVIGIGAYAAPMTVMTAAVLLALYSAARFALAGVAQWHGLRQVTRWSAIDWQVAYRNRASSGSLDLEAVHHVVIIPNYQESIHILRRSLDRLAQYEAAARSMTVVLAIEAREPAARHKASMLQREYQSRFAHMFVVVHPKGIRGEAQCKSANLAWAARWVRRALVDERGYSLDHLVVTTMDADTLWHPQYFASLGTLFATDAERYRTFWQAPIRYHGNVWSSQPMLRLLHAYSAAWELAYLAAPWWQALPMSSYSVSLCLLARVGYWDPDAIADEWHMFIKAFFGSGGRARLQPIFLPFYASAAVGQTFWQALIERYRQTVRHAWGAKEIGYVVVQMRRSSQVPLRQGLGLLLRVAHDNLLAGVGWVILTVGTQLPVVLHPALFGQQMTSPQFVVLQVSLAVMGILTLATWIADMRLRPTRPTGRTRSEWVCELASLPLLALLTLGVVAIPVLHSQTRLMMGMPLSFRVAAKV